MRIRTLECCSLSMILMLSLAAAFTLSRAAAADDFNEHETVTRHLGDDLFATGAQVRVTGDTAGDVIAAGGDLSLEGEVGGDAVIAGGRLAVRRAVRGDLYAAGGELRMEGTVAGNARVAGGHIELDPNAEVSGGMTVAGGDIEIQGRVGRYLQIAAGRTRIDGHIGGDVQATGGELEIGPHAIIDGAVTFRGEKPARVAEGAQVRGGVHNEPSTGFSWQHQGKWFARTLAVLWVLGWAVVGAILIALWPAFTGAVTATARAKPSLSIVIGVLVLIVAPLAIIMLMCTLIGIPLALVCICVYLALLPLGYLAAAAAVGEAALARSRPGQAVTTGVRILALVGALIILPLLSLIPYVGGLIASAVLVEGMGSVILTTISRSSASRAPAG